MYVPDFTIPLNREDLCQTATDGQFFVKYFFSAKELYERLEAAKTALLDEGPSFIVDNFATFYSVFQQFKQLSEGTCQKAWAIISKALKKLIASIQVILDDVINMECEYKNNIRNITKMIFYALIELMNMCQDKYLDVNNIFTDLKGKKKQKLSHDWDWNGEKQEILKEIYSFLQLPIKMFWDPPIVEEEFVNLIANFCYKCLEDPNISSISMKCLRETIFQIFGTLIKNYLHGLCFCVKTVQLLKSHEHLVNPLCKGIVQLVNDCKCSTLVKELIREITDADDDQLAADSSGTRSLNQFLVQLSGSIPEQIISSVELLMNHLAGDSYMMRMCVLEVLGEVILSTLSKENLDEDLKKMRDEFLDALQEHIHDVNAFVRSKVLQIWQKLCLGKAIPVSRLNYLLELAIGRLNDKSTYVKKHAIHLIKDLLEMNPYSAQLSTADIQNQLSEELEKLDILRKTYKVEIQNPNCEWKLIEPKLKEILENISEPSNPDDMDDLSLGDKINCIGDLLMKGDYEASVKELIALKDKVYDVLNLDEDDDDLIVLLRKIFLQKMKAKLLSVPGEVREKLDKCEKTIEYLENALHFSKLIALAVPIILTLLDSNIISDVLESNRFFTAAYLFGFNQALEGVRKMLYLMYSKEDIIKLAVTDAYKNLYFEQNVKGRVHTITTVKKLSDLILNLDESQLNAFEQIIREWLKEGLIDNDFVQVIFERFSGKIANLDEKYRWASLILIRMVGTEEPRFIKSNISVLLNVGLSNAKSQDFFVTKEVCKVLLRLIPEKQPGKFMDHTFRYSNDHDIFIMLHKFLRDSLWRTEDHYYIPMADEAINLVFELCDKPDLFCERLIYEIYERILKGINPLKMKEGMNGKIFTQNKMVLCDALLEETNSESMAENVDKSGTQQEQNEEDIIILTRFISLLGQITANYILFLEGPVLNELKRRNQVEFERKTKKFHERKKKSLKEKKYIENLSCDNLNKNEENGNEDLDFNRVAADDMDADDMKRLTENEIVSGKGYFAKFAPLILHICRNPGKFNSNALQNATVLTLAKYMMVSSIFCEEHLQLLVTISEKSICPQRRKNGIICLGSLQYRFPNTLEPWTPHMYGMLKDSDSSVRLSAVLVITDLIVNEMIKVRSNISDLALCLVDKDITIAKTVRHFFKEYSQKGNSLFNVLPCLISNLIRPDSDLLRDEFKIIMKFIFGLFTKDKQSEYLIEKLFQYFESATTERQWEDLAFCLSLLNFNDKGLKKIVDNFRYFSNKLYLADVYEAFCVIINNAGKNPLKDKMLLKDIQDLIKECRDKSCQDRNVTFSVQKKNLLSVGKKTTNRKLVISTNKKKELMPSKKLSNKCRKKIKFEEDENTDDEDNDEDAFLSDTSVKKYYKSRNDYVKKVADKENKFSEDELECGESPKKQSRKIKNKSIAKKIKGRGKSSDESESESDEEEKREQIKSSRKRK